LMHTDYHVDDLTYEELAIDKDICLNSSH
jgi:hypothetical protein